MRHHLYHEILVFEHPEVQRILLKMLNNKLPMIAENGKNSQVSFGDIFMPRTIFSLPLPHGSEELHLFLLSKLTLIHSSMIL